jgi:hypothetical protein
MEPFVHDAVVDMQIAREQLRATLASLGDGVWERGVPYGSRTVHDVLAHVAAADQVWAVAAQGLLKGEAEVRPPLSAADARAAAIRAMARGRGQSVSQLLDEMDRRRKLLSGLFGLLEKRHLAMRLPAFGDRHHSVRERIWVGYHDRLHEADIRRALAMGWHAPDLRFEPPILPAAEALAPAPTLYVVYSVDPVYWERRVPGLDWTYRQLLAHIATGDWVLQAHLRHIIDHDVVMPWPDIDAGNADRLAERAFTTEAKLVDEYLSMRHQTLLLLSELRPQHLGPAVEMRWLAPPHRGTFLDYVLSFGMHEWSHREQLRGAMKFQTSTRA